MTAKRDTIVIMKVISIDPGYERVGIAIIEKLQSKEVLLFSVRPTPHSNSIPQQHHGIRNLIRLNISRSLFQPFRNIPGRIVKTRHIGADDHQDIRDTGDSDIPFPMFPVVKKPT